MAYVHSSPWQDAANFGGAIGDRLTEALINLPLKKAQMAQELLANAAQLKQRGFQNDVEVQRLGMEKERVGQEKRRVDIDAKNAETRKEAAFSKGLGDIVHGHQASEKQAETVRHDKAMEQNAGARIAQEHLGKGDKALETERHPEFGGRTVKEMMTLLDRNPAEQPDIPPEQVKAFRDYVAALKQGAAKEQGQQQPQIPARGLGDAAQMPTTTAGKRFKYDPASGQLIPQP